MHCELASAQVPSPDSKIICKFHVESSNKIALFYESTFVTLAGTRVELCMSVVVLGKSCPSSPPENVQQQ